MSYVNRQHVTVTTAADGSATAYTQTVNGQVSQIRYVKTDFANGSTMTITDDDTGATIWTEANVNASATRMPRAATHGTDGTASLYAAAGTAVQALIPVANARIKIVIAAGGNAKTGDYYIDLV